MKNLSLFLVTLTLALSVNAKDVLTLKNQQKFEGKILRIKDCSIVFKTNRVKYTIPSDDIYSVEFDNLQNKVYKNYVNRLASGENLCLKAKADAQRFHGKKAGHVILGVLFGPFAIIGTALSDPSPYKSSKTLIRSENREQFNEPEYLICYRKKAKDQLIAMEAVGWFIAIMISSSANN